MANTRSGDEFEKRNSGKRRNQMNQLYSKITCIFRGRDSMLTRKALHGSMFYSGVYRKISYVFRCTIFMIVPILSAKAEGTFDWCVYIDDYNEFIMEYAKCQSEYESATQSLRRVATELAAINEKYPFNHKAHTLKIGEFESLEDFRARVERQKNADKEDENRVLKKRQGEEAKLEEEKTKLLNESKIYREKYISCALAFTNRIREAYLKINAQELPYFDRDSMSFKNICNPFYSSSDVSYEDREREIKFVVNVECTDFDSVFMPEDYHYRMGSKISVSEVKMDDSNASRFDRYRDYNFDNVHDSFVLWKIEKRRKFNMNVAKNISLKFNNLSEAGRFKSDVSSGVVKAWFCCKFRVGVPAKWIVEQGKYEEVIKRSTVWGILNAIKFGVDNDRFHTGYAIWHPAVIGKIVPISIVESKIIIEGDTVKSMDFEIVSSTGTWALEKRVTGVK